MRGDQKTSPSKHHTIFLLKPHHLFFIQVTINTASKDKELETKLNDTKVPETRSFRKSKRETKEKQQNDKTENEKGKNNMKAIKNSFSKPKDRAAKIEVHSDCTKQNRSLELDSVKQHRQNSSDKIKNNISQNIRSSSAVSHLDMSQQLDKIKLDYIVDDNKQDMYINKEQESDHERNSHSEKDEEMDNRSQEAETNINIETRRTRRKIKRPKYLANNYHLEDHKDNKHLQSTTKATDRKKSHSEEKKSAVVTRK